jgi:hypothetical protein
MTSVTINLSVNLVNTQDDNLERGAENGSSDWLLHDGTNVYLVTCTLLGYIAEEGQLPCQTAEARCDNCTYCFTFVALIVFSL